MAPFFTRREGIDDDEYSRQFNLLIELTELPWKNKGLLTNKRESDSKVSYDVSKLTPLSIRGKKVTVEV